MVAAAHGCRDGAGMRVRRTPSTILLAGAVLSLHACFSTYYNNIALRDPPPYSTMGLHFTNASESARTHAEFVSATEDVVIALRSRGYAGAPLGIDSGQTGPWMKGHIMSAANAASIGREARLPGVLLVDVLSARHASACEGARQSVPTVDQGARCVQRAGDLAVIIRARLVDVEQERVIWSWGATAIHDSIEHAMAFAIRRVFAALPQRQ
jgi:hypothetical protein